MSGTRTVVTGQIGFDAVTRGPHHAVGLGLFLGTTADDEESGLALGLRLTFGPF